MSSNETPRIDPKIETIIEPVKIEPILTIADAPPIAAFDQPAAPEMTAEAPKIEREKVEPVLAKPEKIEAAKPESKIDLVTADAVTLPPAPQIESAGIAPRKPAPELASAGAPARSTRFALLAACVAIAASFGAIGGSLGVAKFGPMITSAPPAVAPVSKEHIADEVKALKESVAQLRTTTKALSDNFAGLKTSMASAGTQNAKIAETLERIEKAQTERKTAATSTSEVTGSIAQPKQASAVPMVLGEPPTTLKPPIVPGWALRRVFDGAALIEGRDGIIEVEPGMIAPGLGRVDAIKRMDGRWVVVTARGVIVGR